MTLIGVQEMMHASEGVRHADGSFTLTRRFQADTLVSPKETVRAVLEAVEPVKFLRETIKVTDKARLDTVLGSQNVVVVGTRADVTWRIESSSQESQG